LHGELLAAFKRMAAFYGFNLEIRQTSSTDKADQASGSHRYAIAPSLDFPENARQTWLTRVDHNHLRITRIIRYGGISE
jgi:hypothetical protein